ncbi:MAG: FMN-binding protein [Vicinamibacterales bacterium]|nr:FMN-binding protein [Vicinamibacterales bacterium]
MKSALHMMATLLAVGLLAGGSLSLVNGWAQPFIEQHDYRVKMAGVMEVVPGGVTSRPLAEVAPVAGAQATGDALEAYQVLDGAGAVKGWAVVREGTGFADKIRLMVGLAPDLSSTLGLKVLKDAETPGLGTKIREGSFPDRFFGRGSAPPVFAADTLKVVKGPPGAADEVQAITGATISAKAVVRIINDGTSRLRARLARQSTAGPATAPASPRGEEDLR